MKKRIILSAICLLSLFATAFASAPGQALLAANDSIVSWGLGSFRENQAPTPPPLGAQLLREYDGLWIKETEDKKVFLTFDLGYEAGYTGEVLDILKEHNIKAIFFLCSGYLKEDALIKRMIDEGHQIGNHTHRHKDLPKLAEQDAKKDITKFADAFKEKHPETPLNFFRPPQGRFDAKTLRLAKEQNMRTLMWSIAIKDWGKEPIDAQQCAAKISSRIHPGAIILLHIANSGTPKMLSQLLPKLTDKGYSVGSVNEL